MYGALGVPPYLMWEPGRAVVSEAGTYLSMVTNVIQKPEGLIVQIQDTLEDGICGLLFDDKSYLFEHLSLDGPSAGPMVKSSIRAGSSRESARVSSASGYHLLPSGIKRGDYLYIKRSGAYILGNSLKDPAVFSFWRAGPAGNGTKLEDTIRWIESPKNTVMSALLRELRSGEPLS
jgi:diaminopimelate decarboxylase